jgi:DNA-binding NtrC family response regulator
MMLLVDDDEQFRTGLAANLREDGYEVGEFASPEEVPLDQPGDVEVVLTDYLMGREDGLTFARRFHARYPTVPVIVITAFATAHLEAEVASHDYLSLLHKPLDYGALLDLISRL